MTTKWVLFRVKMLGAVLAVLAGSSVHAEESSLIASTLRSDQFEVGGSFSFASQGGSTSYSVSPSVGYFLSDDFQLSSGLTLSFSSATFTGNATVGGSYYFLKADQYSPFAYQAFGTSFGQTTNNFNGSTGLGVTYLLTSHIGFKTTAGLNYSLSNFSNFANNASFGIAGAFAFYLK